MGILNFRRFWIKWAQNWEDDFDVKEKKTYFTEEFSPDYGIDFARFVRNGVDHLRDDELKSLSLLQLHADPRFHRVIITVTNGFVFLKGRVSQETEKYEAEKLIKAQLPHTDIVNLILF